MKDFGHITLQALGLRVVRLGKAKSLSVEGTALTALRINLGIVHNLGDVEKRLFMEVVPAPSKRSVHQERSEEHTSELQSHLNLVCRLLLEKKKTLTACSKRVC